MSSAPTLRNDHALKFEVLLNGEQQTYAIKDGAHLANASDVFSCPWVAGELIRPQTTHDDVRSATRSGLCPGVTLETEIAAGELQAENLLQLRLSGLTGTPACGRVVCPAAAVLYDFIRLESMDSPAPSAAVAKSDDDQAGGTPAAGLRLHDYVKLTDPPRERTPQGRASDAPAIADCPYLATTPTGLAIGTPCSFAPCVEDSDGCDCLLHQVAYCDQPGASAADRFCASMGDWDPTLIATIEQCRGEAAALQSFADCPFLEQTNFLPGAPLQFDTPCRHQACIADSDSCDCLRYQRAYCQQPDPASQDGMCVLLQKEGTLALEVLAAHCPEPRAKEAQPTVVTAAPVDAVPAGTTVEAVVVDATLADGSECAAEVSTLREERKAAEEEVEVLRARLQKTEGLLLALQNAYTELREEKLAAAEEESEVQAEVAVGAARTVFDDIVAGKAPAEVVLETEDWLAFRDANPQAPVHVLVVPKRRMTGLSSSSDRDGRLLGQLMVAAKKVAEKEQLGDGFRVVVNDGKQGGQSVGYLHVHVLGGRQLRWPPG